MTKISVVINTLNEAKNLPRAIASIKNFADEIVVVDMRSDDKTVGVAKKLGAKVYLHERTSYVEPARNFAISKVMSQSDSQRSQWVLILDADEEVPDTLAQKLKESMEKNKGDYFRIPRKNIIFGKWMQHSRWWPDFNIRFFKKGFVSWSE
ncbi:MAG: glycosyltransferase family 2 protein, partial [Patescibacteria group bacterium]